MSVFGRFAVFVGISFVVAVGAYAALATPPWRALGWIALILLGSAILSLLIGYLSHRLSWPKRSPRVLWTLLAGYAVVGILTLLGVLGTALLMFISSSDVRLVAVLMLFGVGIAISLGYLLAAGLSSEARRLVAAADEVAKGRLDTRVEPRGRDEMADLARAFNDMTAALQTADEKQRAVERMRLDLVAWAGHDLRTPLTSVSVIIEALADGVVTDPSTVERYLQTARSDLKVLSLLIDDLSLLAQIDASGLRLTRDLHDPVELASEVTDSFLLQAQQQSVRLTMDHEPGVGRARFDALQVRRALANVLENAIRHAPEEGEVRIAVDRKRDTIDISIWNDGPPIDPDDIPHLFERFYRGDRSRGRETGKAGLGLAIAKAIMEAHGGTITVRSEATSGTAFVLSLPHDAA